MPTKKVNILCLCLVALLGLSNAESALAQKQVKPIEIKMDTNFDGIVDRIETYNKNKIITKVEADTNNDRKINEWLYYIAGKPIKTEKDTNGNGTPDTFITYDEKGKTIKTEADTTGNGKINEWVNYKNGNPTKAEKDTNGDGKPDTWLTY